MPADTPSQFLALTDPSKCLLNEYRLPLVVPESYIMVIPEYSKRFRVRGLHNPRHGEVSMTIGPVTLLIDLIVNKVEFEMPNSKVMTPVCAALIEEYLNDMKPFRIRLDQDPEIAAFMRNCETALARLHERMEVMRIERESLFITKFGRDALPKSLGDIMNRLA